MGRQQDLTKLKKGELADYLGKKLTREDLYELAQAVQNGMFQLGPTTGQGAPAAPPSAAISAPGTGSGWPPPAAEQTPQEQAADPGQGSWGRSG